MPTKVDSVSISGKMSVVEEDITRPTLDGTSVLLLPLADVMESVGFMLETPNTVLSGVSSKADVLPKVVSSVDSLVPETLCCPIVPVVSDSAVEDFISLSVERVPAAPSVSSFSPEEVDWCVVEEMLKVIGDSDVRSRRFGTSVFFSVVDFPLVVADEDVVIDDVISTVRDEVVVVSDVFGFVAVSEMYTNEHIVFFLINIIDVD